MKRIEHRDKLGGSKLGGEEDEDNEETRRTSRRNFLKDAAITSGVLAAAGVVGVLGAKALDNERSGRKEIDTEREGAIFGVARILDKQYVPSRVVPHAAGKTSMFIRQKEEWKLVLSIEDDLTGEGKEDKQEVVEVSKEQFDSITVGDEVTVSYRIRKLGPIKHREDISLEEK